MSATNPRLIELIRQLSFRTGHFVLTSGKTSDYYIDVRMTSTHPEGAALIGDELLRRIAALPETPKAIGGMALGAVPIVMAVAARSLQFGLPMPAFIVRAEAKTHGAGKRIEGHIADGDPIVIVDDTVTTAKSTLASLDAVAAEYPRCRVACVFAIVDREEGGRERIEERGLAFQALVTTSELRRVGASRG